MFCAFSQCPFNMTGANCDKAVSNDYDIRFYDTILPAQAGLSVPFAFTAAKALTLAMWTRFEIVGSRGTVITLYSSQYVLLIDIGIIIVTGAFTILVWMIMITQNYSFKFE